MPIMEWCTVGVKSSEHSGKTSRPEVFGLGQDEGGSDDKKDDKK